MVVVLLVGTAAEVVVDRAGTVAAVVKGTAANTAVIVEGTEAIVEDIATIAVALLVLSTSSSSEHKWLLL